MDAVRRQDAGDVLMFEPRQIVVAESGHLVAGHQHRAPAGFDTPVEEIEHRARGGVVPAEHADHLAALDRDGEVVEHELVPAAVVGREGHVAQLGGPRSVSRALLGLTW
jgi:hypothetical protein